MRGKGCGVRKAFPLKGIDRALSLFPSLSLEGKSNEKQRVWSKEGMGRGKGIPREREGKSNERQRVWSKEGMGRGKGIASQRKGGKEQ